MLRPVFTPATRRRQHALFRYHEVQAPRDRATGGSTADGNGIQVDHFSDDNGLSHNLLFSECAGVSQTRLAWQVRRSFVPAVFITGVLLADAAVMDATTHAPASDGLPLKRRPTARGLIVASPPKDMAGKAPAAQASSFGAYDR